MTEARRRRAASTTGRAVGLLALTVPVALLAAAPAQATARDTNRYKIVAQGDAMFYEANSLLIPISPKNQAGSLTARVDTNSAGNSTSFAGAPYLGPTATTAGGTASGAYRNNTGMDFPLAPPSAPGYVQSRFPAEPEAATDMGSFRVKATTHEYGGAAMGENGAPAATGAPNQQQTASGLTEAKANGTVVSTATASVKGAVVGPLSALDSSCKATITENGDRTPVITSSASGKFDVGGISVVFDGKGFRVAGNELPANEGLAVINQALANANVKITAVPATTTVDPVSGETTHVIAGLQMSTAQTSPATDPANIDYLFARCAVSSVVVPDGAPDTASQQVLQPSAATGVASGGDLTAGSSKQGLPSDAATVGLPDTSPGADPLLAGDPENASATSGERPRVLGFVRPQAGAVESDSALLYLVLVLGGIGAFVGAQLFGRFGVLLQLRQAVTGGRTE